MRGLILFLIGVFFGVGGGVVLSASQHWSLDGHDAAHHAAGQAGGHDHGAPVEVAGPAPALEVEAAPDPVGGYNLHLVTQNFIFAPESVNGRNVAGEGHAHVYIDGVKLGRFYGPWIHIPTGGAVQVTLNTNDHKAMAVDGAPVEVTLTLD